MKTDPTLFVKACQGRTQKKGGRQPNNPRLHRTVNTRCGVSDREFYEVFHSVDECVLAAFDGGVAHVSTLLAQAASSERGWADRARAALSALLVFCDEQPGWARFLIDESAVATIALAERRQRALAALARALAREMQADANSSGWFVPSSELCAELILGGVISVLRGRILTDAREPLAGLAPQLAAFIVEPFPGSGRNLDLEQERAANASGLPTHRVPVRTTYRTTRVLSAIADSPGLSNREIAEAAGLSDEGQTSKLLRRLEQRGLVENFGLGQPHGGANAWLLTAYGERVLDATRHSLVPGAGAVVGRRVRGTA
jgi:AcrR family transcriptional regulator